MTLREQTKESLPRATVVIHGDDIGVVDSVTIEIDGVPVARLMPQRIIREMDRCMGRSITTLVLTEGVEWVPRRPDQER